MKLLHNFLVAKILQHHHFIHWINHNPYGVMWSNTDINCSMSSGRFTTEEEIDRAIDLCVEKVNRLRDMSPLWEMVQEGIDLKTIEWSQH